MLRKEKDIYIALFRQYHGVECAKIGISHNPAERIRQLNGYTVKKKKPYVLYAVFAVNDDSTARAIELAAIRKFEHMQGREYFDVHPERVYTFVKRELKKAGIKTKPWRNENWMDEETAKIL